MYVCMYVYEKFYTQQKVLRILQQTVWIVVCFPSEMRWIDSVLITNNIR